VSLLGAAPGQLHALSTTRTRARCGPGSGAGDRLTARPRPPAGPRRRSTRCRRLVDRVTRGCAGGGRVGAQTVVLRLVRRLHPRHRSHTLPERTAGTRWSWAAPAVAGRGATVIERAGLTLVAPVGTGKRGLGAAQPPFTGRPMAWTPVDRSGIGFGSAAVQAYCSAATQAGRCPGSGLSGQRRRVPGATVGAAVGRRCGSRLPDHVADYAPPAKVYRTPRTGRGRRGTGVHLFWWPSTTPAAARRAAVPLCCSPRSPGHPRPSMGTVAGVSGAPAAREDAAVLDLLAAAASLAWRGQDADRPRFRAGPTGTAVPARDPRAARAAGDRRARAARRRLRERLWWGTGSPAGLTPAARAGWAHLRARRMCRGPRCRTTWPLLGEPALGGHDPAWAGRGWWCPGGRVARRPRAGRPLRHDRRSSWHRTGGADSSRPARGRTYSCDDAPAGAEVAPVMRPGRHPPLVRADGRRTKTGGARRGISDGRRATRTTGLPSVHRSPCQFGLGGQHTTAVCEADHGGVVDVSCVGGARWLAFGSPDGRADFSADPTLVVEVPCCPCIAVGHRHKAPGGEAAPPIGQTSSHSRGRDSKPLPGGVRQEYQAGTDVPASRAFRHTESGISAHRRVRGSGSRQRFDRTRDRPLS